MIEKIAIPLYTLGLAASFWIKKMRVQRTIGRNPVIIGPKKTLLESCLQRLALVYFILWIGGLHLFAYLPWLTASLPGLKAPHPLIGLSLLFFSLLVFIVGLIHLKEAWRFGIDREGTNRLVTSGIYGLIRHPIYTAMKLACVATVILFPNLYFLILESAAFFGFSVMALLEEDFLKSRFGLAYEEYMQKTGRFYPKILCGSCACHH